MNTPNHIAHGPFDEEELPQAFLDLLFYHLKLRCFAMGVANWETWLVESLPDELKGTLPTIEE